MKNLEKNLPYLLLITYLITASIQPLTIAESIIAVALCLFSGYRAYLNQKEQPNYTEQFKDALDKHEESIKNLQNTVGQYALSQKRIKEADKLRW